MTYHKRRILFFASVAVFLLISGPLLLYTFGYRFSLSNFSLRETGGAFIHTNPAGAAVTIGTQNRTSSFLTGNVFIQNLEPGLHALIVSYPGYQQWEKTVAVEPRSVVEFSPLLLPIALPAQSLFPVASTTHAHISPRGSLFLLQQTEEKSSVYRIYDTAQNRILPLADALSRARITSISPEAYLTWNQSEQSAIIETQDDWLILTRTNNTIRVRSLYKHSKLATHISRKPDFLDQDPTNLALYYVLDGTNFLRWNSNTETLQQVLQDIAGFSLSPTHVILWDTQSSKPYQTTLQATDARSYATSSLPGITRTHIQERDDNLLLFANNGLWIFPNSREPRLLTKTYNQHQVVFTDAYVMWWDAHALTVYWTLPPQDMPLYQKERMEMLYEAHGIIRNVSPYPEESYIILQEDNAIYILELDSRGGKRNKQMMYKGENPTFYIPPDEKVMYILDKGSMFSIELP